MPRFRLDIEYDGTGFCGWQVQAQGLSVQGAIEAAVRRFSGEAVRLQCAGRTDAGVHATGQVAHLDLIKAWRTDVVRDAVNAHLKPLPVAILAAAQVPATFNARLSAVQRHYRYVVLNRRPPPALGAATVWHVPYALDADRMAASAASLLGRHDFTTFRASECQATGPWRTLERFDVARRGDLIEIDVSARSFLHSQVRSMVGTIAQAGAGRWEVDAVRRALDARSRRACGPLAPPSGLFLARVDYPSADEAADEAAEPEIGQESEQHDPARDARADAEGQPGGEELRLQDESREGAGQESRELR